MKIMIEEWDGDGAIRIPDEALQELELDVGDAVYLIEEFVGNTRCLVLSKTPQIADRIDELTEAWDIGQPGNAPGEMIAAITYRLALVAAGDSVCGISLYPASAHDVVAVMHC